MAYQSINPYNGKLLKTFKELTSPQLEKALKTAAACFEKVVDKLMALTGSEFDKAYIAEMFKGHKKAIKAFQGESAETKDADLKSFTDKSIPVLKEHLKLITTIKKS